MQNYNNLYNPYGFGYQMQDPNQLRQQIEQQLSSYQNAYNRNQNIQNQNNNKFVGMYVENEAEVLNAQIPADGTAMLFVGNGIMWSKKFVNGQPYISTYRFEPINNVGEPKGINIQENEENSKNGKNEGINQILDYLEKLDKRLVALEGKDNE